MSAPEVQTVTTFPGGAWHGELPARSLAPESDWGRRFFCTVAVQHRLVRLADRAPSRPATRPDSGVGTKCVPPILSIFWISQFVFRTKTSHLHTETPICQHNHGFRDVVALGVALAGRASMRARQAIHIAAHVSYQAFWAKIAGARRQSSRRPGPSLAPGRLADGRHQGLPRIGGARVGFVVHHRCARSVCGVGRTCSVEVCLVRWPGPLRPHSWPELECGRCAALDPAARGHSGQWVRRGFGCGRRGSAALRRAQAGVPCVSGLGVLRLAPPPAFSPRGAFAGAARKQPRKVCVHVHV